MLRYYCSNVDNLIKGNFPKNKKNAVNAVNVCGRKIDRPGRNQQSMSLI